MHFDALTLACVTDELKRTLVGGRTQQILRLDETSIGLEIYAQHQRHYLLLAVDAQKSRVHLVTQKLRRGAEQPSPLLMLLRKYVRDSLLENVRQPEPTERVLHFHFVHNEHGPTTLVAEMLGQRSNLLLLNAEHKILDCLRRVWPGEKGERSLLPGQLYHPPLPQAKLAPIDDGSPDYYQRLAELTNLDGKLWKVLTNTVTGSSPTLAREVAWRVTGNLDAAAQEANVLALAQALQELWSPVVTGDWQPGIWLEETSSPALSEAEGVSDNPPVVGFSAYMAHVRGEFVPTTSISAALEKFFTQVQPQKRSGSADTYASVRGQVSAELGRAKARILRQLAALAGDEPAPGASAQIRTQAEWLLALNTQIEPNQPLLEVDVGEDEPLKIILDPRKTPVEQAQQMFKTAAKWTRAAQIIPERRLKLQNDLEFLTQLGSDLALAENQPEIAAVQE